MIRKYFQITALAALVLAGCAQAGSSARQSDAISSQKGLDVVTLHVASADGKKHSFRVEIARTQEQQAIGLMYIDNLGVDEGMVFPFPYPRPASFWMKNTFIPLDMLFIRQDCSIAKIEVNTIPQSLQPIGTEEYVAAVLEIAGGRSVELGIEEGDCVSWPGGPSPRQ